MDELSAKCAANFEAKKTANLRYALKGAVTN